MYTVKYEKIITTNYLIKSNRDFFETTIIPTLFVYMSLLLTTLMFRYNFTPPH